MFSKFIKVRLVAFLTVLVLPALVSANCLTTELATNTVDPDETGYTTHILVDQGQGNFDCTTVIGLEGKTMVPVAITTDPTKKGTVNDPVEWSITSTNPEIHADLIFASSSEGARCLQWMAGNARSGNAGAGTKNKNATVIACTDGVEEELPPPPPTLPIPPDITEDGCPDDFQNAINIPGDEWDVMILNGSPKLDDNGLSVPGEGRSAICIDQTLNGGNPNDPNPPALNRCANRCIIPDAATTGVDWIPFVENGQPRSERLPGGICTDTFPNFDGTFPIECRVCELASEVNSDPFEPDLQFCWEQGQDVQLDTSGLGNGSFNRPPPDRGNQGWAINGKFGSTCYLISGRTRSGYPYSYWAPSGCPN